MFFREKGGANMENFKLRRMTVSLKLLCTSLLCVAGLVYLSLLIHIWQDTGMKPELIAKGYCSMEAMELTEHCHKYLPYYVFYIFLFPTAMFMFASYPEKIKRVFAVLPYVLIVADIGSMCLIPYVSQNFCWGLFFAGMLLGVTFLALFIMLIYDIWFRKIKEADGKA